MLGDPHQHQAPSALAPVGLDAGGLALHLPVGRSRLVLAHLPVPDNAVGAARPRSCRYFRTITESGMGKEILSILGLPKAGFPADRSTGFAAALEFA